MHQLKKLHTFFKRITNYVKNSLSSKGFEVWNELKPELKGMKIYYAFKNKSNDTLYKSHVNSILNPLNAYCK